MGRKRKAESVLDLDGDRDASSEARDDDPIQRNAANARERARMRVLSKAFTKLKTTLPWVPPDTKLSKLDTLRLASCYIAHLRQILTDDNSENSPVMAGIAARNSLKYPAGASVHPVTLTWPFSFNGSTAGRQNETSNFADSATSPVRMPHNKSIAINKPS